MDELRLNIYQTDAQGNEVLFPNVDGMPNTVLGTYKYDAKRMGGAPVLQGSVKHPVCLDNYWNGKQYVKFNGERYYTKNTPSSSKDNTSVLYNHEIEFVSERIKLEKTYFINVVTDGSDTTVSNSPNFIFFGNVHEYVRRLNYALSYAGLPYTVVVDDGIGSEDMQVAFDKVFIMSAIQQIYDVYKIPFYFTGHVCHVGFTDNAITEVLRYGFSDALLKASKTNANNRIINRCSGYGSTDNIPFYYPNPSNDREAIGDQWIEPSKTLMPPIYRESKGKERFYNALNDTYTDPSTGMKYAFENVYTDDTRSEDIVDFSSIRPSIKGITNSLNQRMDQVIEFAYDLNDNDNINDKNEYEHPYFFAKLRKTDGTYGFNLFNQALAGGTASMSMTSGNTGACVFEIGIIEDETRPNTFYNTVQLNEDGTLKRDADGNVVRSGTPQPIQQDTRLAEVWVALKKDDTTFGIVMPNVGNNYKPAGGDTFVFLGIDMPQSFITKAENELKEEIIKHMFLNNSDKFNFSIDFSRIYLAQNPNVLNRINENARLLIEYNNKEYTFYVNSYTYDVSNDEALPKITVELADTLTINRGALFNAIDGVKQEIMSSVGSVDFYKQGLKYFLRKDVNDRARGIISTDAGFEVGRYTKGALGQGGFIGANGNAELQSLTLNKSLNVPEIHFNRALVYTGINWQTFGMGSIETVTIDKDADGNNLNSGTIKLRLEEGEFGAIDVNDLCMGIFHDYAGDNELAHSDDRRGNFKFAGFQTVYFRITDIIDRVHNGEFRYVLRGISERWNKQYHPHNEMKFACYANPVNTSRQSCIYSTTEYKIGLKNMTTWEYDSNNIYEIDGLLDGFIVNEKVLSGYGQMIGNGLFYGQIEIFEKIEHKMIFDLGGDSFLGWGECKTIVTHILDGYGRDVTANYSSWSITRETNNSIDDAIWNASPKARAFNGTITLCFKEDENDIGGFDSAMFLIKATESDTNKILETYLQI